MPHSDPELKAACDKAWRLNNPEKVRAYRRKYYLENTEQIRQRARDYYHANAEACLAKSRENGRRYRSKNADVIRAKKRLDAGLPEPTRPCPEACECCGGPPGRRALSLDHDHGTGCFRGWLCGNCNTGIGKLGDTIDGLQLATDYLKRS